MSNVYDVLAERGFIEQATHEEEVRSLLANESVSFYIGFDPTADSLHVGHFIQIMVMMHMQRHGHRPIALCGGGTGMVGDPSGRSDMRKMLTVEQIEHNVAIFKKQFARFIDFGQDKAIIVNNADWLLSLNYIEFLRDIGRFFSVNRMLAAECFKNRLESGLSFLEFNYMLMQAYDFLELYRRFNCKMQLGGSDQWSNIIAGVDLIRKADNASAYGLTFKLLVTSEGKKMGKTEAGALWLDPEKTSPYEFYQYWRNVDDPDVKNCLALLTFLPMDEVNRLCSFSGSELNKAKEVLAFEITRLVHGEDEAVKARAAASSLFGGGAEGGSIPTTEFDKTVFDKGIDIISLLSQAGLISTNSEGRRLVQQGGVMLNGEVVTDFNMVVTSGDLENDKLMLRKGKKVYHRVVIK